MNGVEQQAPPPQDGFLTIPGLVKELNRKEKVASREFVYRMAKGGAIPTYRMGRRIFVRLPEVLDALRAGSTGE